MKGALWAHQSTQQQTRATLCSWQIEEIDKTRKEGNPMDLILDLGHPIDHFAGIQASISDDFLFPAAAAAAMFQLQATAPIMLIDASSCHL